MIVTVSGWSLGRSALRSITFLRPTKRIDQNSAYDRCVYVFRDVPHTISSGIHALSIMYEIITSFQSLARRCGKECVTLESREAQVSRFYFTNSLGCYQRNMIV